MLQFKLIRSESTRIERDINEWLVQLCNDSQYKYSIVDFKQYHIDGLDLDGVMFLYDKSPRSNRQNDNLVT
jgi:hypothetical protein